jgi:hypothetical protein
VLDKSKSGQSSATKSTQPSFSATATPNGNDLKKISNKSPQSETQSEKTSPIEQSKNPNNLQRSSEPEEGEVDRNWS